MGMEEKALLETILSELKNVQTRLEKIERKEITESISINDIREKNIRFCLDCIDFDCIHNVMVMLNWTWANVGIPTVEDLKIQSEKLLRECFKEMDEYNEKNSNDPTESYVIHTGGLKVRTWNTGDCELYFIVESANSME